MTCTAGGKDYKYRLIIVIHFDLVLHLKNDDTPPLKWVRCREDEDFCFCGRQSYMLGETDTICNLMKNGFKKKEANICLERVNKHLHGDREP